MREIFVEDLSKKLIDRVESIEDFKVCHCNCRDPRGTGNVSMEAFVELQLSSTRSLAR
jgi:hypothetical protein